MDILVVVNNDLRVNSSSNVRVVSLIKCLHDQGHIIHVIMYNSTKQSDTILTSLLTNSACISLKHFAQENKHAGAEESPSSNTQSTSLKSRAIKLLTRVFPFDLSVLYNRSIFLNSVLPSHIDVIISSSDPNSSHVLARKYKRQYPQAKWIQYWGDIMSEDVQFGGRKRLIVNWCEKWLLTKADKVIYTNPIVTEYMKEKHPTLSSKLDWIPTPFEVGHVEQDDGASSIGYFGSYSTKNRNIINLCQAALHYNYDMIVAGSGNIDLPQGIRHTPRCSFAELSQYQRQCSIITIMENKYIELQNGQKGCLQIPGKLYHYANSNQYILVICEGDGLKTHYQQYDRFIFCENKIQSIGEKIKLIQQGKYDNTLHQVYAFTKESIISQWQQQMC